MKQSRELGKKKLATRSISVILALVFVFSIFSGMASAECKMINEHVYTKFHPTAAPEVEKQCEFKSSTCEESKWERTTITTTKGNLEIITERTYACKCENTNESAIESRKETEWENDIVKYDYPFKTDYLTGGATCKEPCQTPEKIKEAQRKLVLYCSRFIGLKNKVALYKMGLKGIGRYSTLAKWILKGLIYLMEKDMENAELNFHAAGKKLEHLQKLPPCVPIAQRPPDC
jgi:hypothetical protein